MQYTNVVTLALVALGFLTMVNANIDDIEEDLRQQCPDPSYFAVPFTDCRMFYQCQQLQSGEYSLIKQTCPGSLQFDTTSNVCNWPAVVTCNDEHEEAIRQQCPDPSYSVVPFTDCRSFYQCQPLQGGGYDLIRQSCPANLQFDISINVCNWPDAVTCNDEHEEAIRQQCPDPSYSVVPFTDCRSFYQCQPLQGGGYDLIRQSCPANLQFDISINVCNWPDAVTCNDPDK